MKELLETFTVEQIIIFLALLGFSIKEVVSFFDWASAHINQKVKKENVHDELKNEIKTLNNDLKAGLKEIYQTVDENKKTQEKMQKTISLLVESDKDDIKSWITERHHYFCYEKGYIDDYNLDCMEKRFKHYIDEHGNSFVEELMEEVRHLPRISQNKK